MVKNQLQCPCLVLLAATCVFADEDAISVSHETDASAARLMAAVRVIEREHYDPPPRQELVHRLMRRLAARFNIPVPPGLGRELSAITDDTKLEEAFAEFYRDLMERSSSNPDIPSLPAVEKTVLRDLVNSLPGPNVVRTRKQHVVDQQFANNQYVGTGVSLMIFEELPQIGSVVENGPAHKAGAKDRDLILEIDGEGTKGMRIEDVVDRLRGPAGSAVTVKLEQPNSYEVRELTITRGVVPLRHTRLLDRRDGPMVIVIEKLTAATVQELREIEEQLGDSSEEVVLHINSGGASDLHHAVLLADALLDGGEIGRARTTSGVREFTASRDCLFRDHPIKMQVWGYTSGPAEWIVAALQDNGRATIVGQRTAGQPFVTEAYEVPGTDWVLELTYRVLERADGRRLLRTRTRPSPEKPHAVMLRSSDGRKAPVFVQNRSDDHDGGVVPDETVPAVVLEYEQAPTQISPIEPPTEGVKSLREQLLRGGSTPE